MEWFSKHVDTVVILTAFASAVLWMNGKFNELDARSASMEKDIAIIKTVMVTKNIMPCELAKAGE
jgi:hypothetical protein